MSAENPKTFLERWSRLKQAERTAGPADPADGMEEARESGATPAASPAPEAEVQRSGEAADERSSDVNTDARPPRDYADFDFEALDYRSDYREFMDRGVPDDVRNKALRKLWVSNPILANIDGLDDYCEDYTDAAVCLPAGAMKTAYRVGRGFLSDEEVAEWEALGRPEKSDGAEPGEAREDRGRADVAAAAGETENVAAADEAPQASELAAAGTGEVAASSADGAEASAADRAADGETEDTSPDGRDTSGRRDA